MAIASTMVWEVRSAGSATLNGGGGFKPGATGVDYSQQNAVQYALTGGTTAGVTDTVLHTSASTDMVGNTALLGGTNVTAGYYEIIAVSAGVSIQFDRNCTTGVGAAITIKIGGATATIASIAASVSHVTPGNIIWVKGTFTGLNSDSVVATGTAALPIIVEGYNSTRGDGYLGRTSSNGPLITTNYPSLTYAAAQRLNPSGAYVFIKYLTVVTNNGTGAITSAGNGHILSCAVTNNSNSAAAIGISGGSAGGVTFNCDISLPSGVAGSIGATCVATGGRVIANRITNPGGTGITTAGGATVTSNLIYSCAIGMTTTTVTTSAFIWGNTIANITGDGIAIVASTTTSSLIGMNMITNCGGFGVNMTTNTAPGQLIYNRFRDNTSGNVGNFSAQVTASMIGSVTSGGGTSDYNNSGSGDYTLKTTSPAVNAGIPYAASMGAYEPVAGGGSSGTVGYGFVA